MQLAFHHTRWFFLSRERTWSHRQYGQKLPSLDRGPGCSGYNTFTLRSEPRRVSGPEASLELVEVLTLFPLLLPTSGNFSNIPFPFVWKIPILQGSECGLISTVLVLFLSFLVEQIICSQRCQVQALLFCFLFYFSSRQGFSVYPSISWNWPCTLLPKCWDYRCAHNHYLTGSKSYESLVLVKSLYPLKEKVCCWWRCKRPHSYIYSLQSRPYICLYKNLEIWRTHETCSSSLWLGEAFYCGHKGKEELPLVSLPHLAFWGWEEGILVLLLQSWSTAVADVYNLETISVLTRDDD